jgi:hypothetical protein
MRKRIKIILMVSIAVLAIVVFLIYNGLQLMAIEDHYGDLQDVYYKSETGDLIIGNDKRVGFIKKLENRIYVDDNGCMKDLYNWVNENQQPLKFSVYRPEVTETFISKTTYNELENLVQEQKLKPIISSN